MSGLSSTLTFCMVSRRSADSANAFCALSSVRKNGGAHAQFLDRDEALQRAESAGQYKKEWGIDVLIPVRCNMNIYSTSQFDKGASCVNINQSQLLKYLK